MPLIAQITGAVALTALLAAPWWSSIPEPSTEARNRSRRKPRRSAGSPCGRPLPRSTPAQSRPRHRSSQRPAPASAAPRASQSRGSALLRERRPLGLRRRQAGVPDQARRQRQALQGVRQARRTRLHQDARSASRRSRRACPRPVRRGQIRSDPRRAIRSRIGVGGDVTSLRRQIGPLARRRASSSSHTRAVQSPVQAAARRRLRLSCRPPPAAFQYRRPAAPRTTQEANAVVDLLQSVRSILIAIAGFVASAATGFVVQEYLRTRRGLLFAAAQPGRRSPIRTNAGAAAVRAERGSRARIATPVTPATAAAATAPSALERVIAHVRIITSHRTSDRDGRRVSLRGCRTHFAACSCPRSSSRR